MRDGGGGGEERSRERGEESLGFMEERLEGTEEKGEREGVLDQPIPILLPGAPGPELSPGSLDSQRSTHLGPSLPHPLCWKRLYLLFLLCSPSKKEVAPDAVGGTFLGCAHCSQISHDSW